MNKKIIVIVVVILVLGIAGFGIYGALNSEGKINVVSVEEVKKGDISFRISASGIVEEADKKDVYFESSVKVEKILLKKYDRVKKGQRVLVVDLDNLYEQRKAIEETPISTSSTSKTSAVSSRTNSNSAVTMPSNNTNPYAAPGSNTYPAGAPNVALNQMNPANTSASAYQGMNSSIAQSSTSNVQTIPQNSSAGMQSSMTKDEKKKQLKKIDEEIASLKNSEKSPIDGVISDISVRVNISTNSVQPAFSVVDDKNLIIRAQIKEDDLRYVSVGQRVDITGDAYNEDEKITGKVKSIAPLATRQIGVNGQESMIEAIISVDKKIGVLRPGLSADCSILANEKKDVVLASYVTLQDDKDGNKFVYVLNEDPENKSKDNDSKKTFIVKKIQLELGLTEDLDAEVLKGLIGDETVVVNPEAYLTDGMKVRIKK